MEYTKYELGAYNLHLIKTDKFKTIQIKISLKAPVKKEDSTYRHLLCGVMNQTTKNYKTKRDLIIKKQELYSASIQTENIRLGNYINTTFSLNVLNDKYTEKDNFNKSLQFLKEVLFNVDVKDNHFNEESFKREIEEYKLDLEGIKEDSESYSAIRLYEAMEKEGPSSYRGVGYLDILNEITPESLYKYYQEMMRSNLMDIFVIGDFDQEEMLELIKNTIPIQVFHKQRKEYIVEEKMPRKRRLFATETADNLQTKLVYGFRINKLTPFERNYVITIFNIMFGGGVETKLFRELREKHSLCYVINSVCNKFDNIMLVRAGIEGENKKKTIELIDKELIKIKKGKFTQEELDTAREFYYTVLDTTEESPSRIINDYLMMITLGTDSIEQKREKIKQVTREDIMKVVKKIKGDTVFCLEGDKE